MAQFDVHRNVGAMRSSMPFIVVVQSKQFDSFYRRAVVPLVLKKDMSGSLSKSRSRTNPEFVIERQTVVLHPLEMNTIPANKLGEFVCSLKDEGSIISDALDELFTRTWG